MGSVQEYRQEFAKRAARVKNWPEHCLLGVFLNGLKEELKADVRVHKPRSVYKAVSLALEYEFKVQSNYGPKTSNPTQPFRPNTSSGISRDSRGPVTNQTMYRSSATLPTQVTTTSLLSINRPWDVERQARRDKGLCFHCNEKFSPGHRCKSSTLALMELTDEDTKVGEGLEIDEPEATHTQGDLAEISFHAILGKTIGTTMKIQGTLRGYQVLILIDSGSTHNFIYEKLV